MKLIIPEFIKNNSEDLKDQDEKDVENLGLTLINVLKFYTYVT